MTQESTVGSYKTIHFVHVVAAKLSVRTINIACHEDRAVAEALCAQLQAAHDAKPKLGNFGDLGPEEAFARRAALAEWVKAQPIPERTLDSFECYDVVAVAKINPDTLVSKGTE